MKNTLKSSILRDIDTIARETHAIYETTFRTHLLQRGQFLFLSRICENPGITMVNLGYNLRMDKTTVTKAIQKLIKSGYVIKEEDQEDRRLIHLFPTQKALEMYKEIINEKNRIIDICIKNLPLDYIETMQEVLTSIIKNIDVEWQRIIKSKK